MPVRNLLDDIHAQPFPEFHHPLPMTGGAEVAPLAGKCQEIFVAIIFTLHAGKAVVQIAAVETTIDYLLDIGPPESVLSIGGESFYRSITEYEREPTIMGKKNRWSRW
ncbi:MAG: hypothetical protein Q7I93_00890 [Syntrophales bacterium]|nr:hypothetical protein [Syntrophales bacterium]